MLAEYLYVNLQNVTHVITENLNRISAQFIQQTRKIPDHNSVVSLNGKIYPTRDVITYITVRELKPFIMWPRC